MSKTTKDSNVSLAETASETTKGKQDKNLADVRTKDKGGRLSNVVSKGANVVLCLGLLFVGKVANNMRSILYPTFPDIDPRTQQFIPKHGNIFNEGDALRAKLWVDKSAWPQKVSPFVEFEFNYTWEGFESVSKLANASISQAQISKGENVFLSAEVLHIDTGRIIRAKGDLLKGIDPPEKKATYHLLTGEECPSVPEPFLGKPTKRKSKRGPKIARAMPMMQVRLVVDFSRYPIREPYLPALFVDEFWLTNDQLIKLNTTGMNTFSSQIEFNLMGIARHRFQSQMQRNLEETAKSFGEDSEEVAQVRDMFANTNPYLLLVTMVVMVLEMIFEFLAFKSDVEFFGKCDAETLNTYVSVQSIILGIVMQSVLLLYLWDESSNMLVLVISAVTILVDMWKVSRAMKVEWRTCLSVFPFPYLVARVSKEKKDDFDSVAMKWLSVILLPCVLGYAAYSLMHDCHKCLYSFLLLVSATSVYSLGFVLMTPQIFINYKHKSVAYLPWKKFVYRACCTFIDDLFAMIIRMPTMHRLSCFRDDVVFLIYLYQRRIYKVDKTRTFDEEGYEVAGNCETTNDSVVDDKKNK